MKKAVILGTDNTHALSFARALTDGYLPGVELWGAWGENEKDNDRLREIGVTRFAAKPDGFVGEADVALIVARNGDLHFSVGMPYALAGTPLWIDKPFCIDAGKARLLLKTLRDTGTPVSGGSFLPFASAVRHAETIVRQTGNVLGGEIVGPIRQEPEYGGFFFYTQHLIEIMLTVFGRDPLAVKCSRTEDGYRATVRYPSFDVGLCWCVNDFHYDLRLCLPEGVESFTVTAGEVAGLHFHELDTVGEMLCAHRSPMTDCDLLRPLDILHALYDAMDDGTFHPLAPFSL